MTVLAIFMTWLFNNTGGSVLMTVLAHFAFNAGQAFIVYHFRLIPGMVFSIACSASLALLVVAIVIYYGPKRLSRSAPASKTAA